MRKTLLVLAFAVCSVARADIIPTFEGVSAGPVAGTFEWVYTINVAGDTRVENGNFFVIYDFGSYVPDSVFAPDGWSADDPLVGPVGHKQNPEDDPLTVNLHFTRTGGTIVGPTPVGAIGPFGALATTDQIRLSERTSDTIKDSTGNPQGNIGDIEVPTGQEDVIPEPGTMALLGSALLGLGVLRHRRR